MSSIKSYDGKSELRCCKGDYVRNRPRTLSLPDLPLYGSQVNRISYFIYPVWSMTSDK